MNPVDTYIATGTEHAINQHFPTVLDLMVLEWYTVWVRMLPTNVKVNYKTWCIISLGNNREKIIKIL